MTTNTKPRGYSCIGLHHPRFDSNIGSALRAVGSYQAAFLAINSKRKYNESRLDVRRVYRHIPLIQCGDLKNIIPYGCTPVAVDLVPDAIHLPEYFHPERAFYIFGPENGTLDDSVLSWCRERVYIDTFSCMNLAATVNVVLYDRFSKQRTRK